MKDDLFILNTLGRRHLPRLLPVIVIAAAAVTALMIYASPFVYSVFKGEGQLLMVVMIVELLWACLVLEGPTDKQSGYRYSVGMLRISERRAFADCCVFNVLVFLLIWASLCCAAIIAGNAAYTAEVAGLSTPMLYTNYMLDQFMQVFAPMDGIAVTVSVMLFMLTFGLLSARDFAARMRGKGRGWLVLVPMIGFLSSLGTSRTGGSLSNYMMCWSITLFIAALFVNGYMLSVLSRGTNVEVDDGQ